MLERIDAIVHEVYFDNLPKAINEATALFEEILSWPLDAESDQLIKKLLNEVMNAINYKDYVLFADILYFELKPLISEK